MKKIGALLALALSSCADPNWNPDGTKHVALIFVDFYDDHVTVDIDGKVFWSGDLTVSKENETLGLSMFKEADLPRCSTITLHSKRFSDSKKVCLTGKTKMIYFTVNEPHISTSEKDVVQLD